jgi:glutamate-1-semialdehyde 2,1-aminomutase
MSLDQAINRWTTCMGARSTEACQLTSADGWLLAGLLVGILAVAYTGRKLSRTLLTLPALALTPALSRQLSNWVKARDYEEEEFFRADGADGRWIEVRKKALEHLASFLRAQHAQSIAWGNAIRDSFSDLRFTDANRVPFPFVRVMREKFNLCSVVTASQGPRLQNLDGHWTIDVSGSYGVNVAGFDRYKEWIEKGWERVKDLGPVLGPLHPVVAENIAMLRTVSHMDEVFFSYERHGSCDGRRAHDAVQYSQEADRLFLRGLSRLVGRCATWAGERASPRRLSHAQGRQRGVARRHSAAGKGDRRRAGQPGAVVPSQLSAAQ